MSVVQHASAPTGRADDPAGAAVPPPQIINFLNVSNIDQRCPELGAHAGSITAHHGIYR